MSFYQRNNWEADERVVYADGFNAGNTNDGNVEVYDLTKAGITDPDLVWRHARWRLADMSLRLGIHAVRQGIENLQHVPGDLVAFQHYVPLLGLGRGRIKSHLLDVGGAVTAVTIDDEILMEAGHTYEVRVRLIDDSGVDQYLIRGVHNDAGGTLFTETWTGTNGAAWPTARWNAADPQGAGSAVDIQSNAGRLLAMGEASARARIIAKSGALLDFGLTAQITIATGGQTANNEFHNLNFRASGAWSVSNEQDRLHGYSLEFRTTGGARTLQLVSVVNSARTTLGSPVAKAWGTSPWSVRVQCVGTAIKAKVWQGAEPASWDIEVTNAAHAAGDISFSTVNGADAAARTATWDTLAVQSLTSTQVLRFTTPFAAAAAPQLGDLLTFGETNLATINCIVKDVLPGQDLTAQLILIDEAPAIFDADTGAIPAYNSQITLPGDFFGIPPAVPVISGISIRNISHNSQPDLITQQQLVVQLAAVSSQLPPPIGYEVEIKRADQQVYQRRHSFPGNAVELTLDVVQSDTLYDIRARATGRSPRNITNESAWSTVRQIYVPLPKVTYAATARVAGLELQGQGNDVTFEGPDAHFVWRLTSTSGAFQIHGGTQDLIGFVDPQFAWYEVVVIDPTNAYERRKVTTTTPEFIYSIADNKADSRKQAAELGGSNRPLRLFTVTVKFTDKFGRQGPGQALTVENPAPEVPTGILVSGQAQQINIRADIPDDDDLEGIVVYVGTASGFNPAAPSTQVVKTLGTNIAVIAGQPAGVTRFLRVAFFDRFSDEVADLNLTSEFAVVVESPTGPPVFTPEGITFRTAGNTVFWTSGTMHISHGATTVAEAVTAGQRTWSSGTIWLFYVQGFGALQSTLNPGLAQGDDRKMVALYQGGKRISNVGSLIPPANIVSVGATGQLGGGVNAWVTVMSCPPITTVGNDVDVNFVFAGTASGLGQGGVGANPSITILGRVRRSGTVLRDYTRLASDTTGTPGMLAETGQRYLGILDTSVGAGTHTYDWQMRANFADVDDADADWSGIKMTVTETLFT